jgi:ligand-binding sensor domain-containing protein/AraC-like DNA-binding protein
MKVILTIYTGLLIPFLLMGQNQSLKFKHISLEKGLSQSSITCILKDSRGFMWFGSEDGLNKYDGTDFTVYRHMSTDKESLSSSYIHAIAEQEDGFLWIGTNNGLNYFNPDSEKFTRYVHNPNDPKSVSHNNVNTLYLTHDKRLIAGTSNGLNIFDPRGGFIKYSSQNSRSPYNVVSVIQDKQGYIWALSSEMIEKIKWENGYLSRISFYKLPAGSIQNAMFPDSSHLWIGTSKGLIKFNLHNQKFDAFRFYDLKVSDDSRNNVQTVISDQTGNLWLGTIGGGLIHFDKVTGKFETVLNDPYNPFSINSNMVRSIFLDEKEILWLGTYGGGINKYDPAQFKFQHYYHQPGERNSLSNNGVRAILLDRDGELWVGTHGGLNRMNRKTGQVKVYKYEQNNPATISSNTIRALCEDSAGTIWAGAWDNGLNSFDKQTGKFKRYIYLPGRTDSLRQVRSLETDARGNIWIGSNGLWKFNPITKECRNYLHEELKANNPGGNIVNKLYFDQSGLLWVGMQNGLYCLDTATNAFRKYLHSPQDTLSISHPHVTSIAEDKNGLLWVGTYGGGLNVLDVSTGVFKHYNTKNGLLNDVIYAILIDDPGFIWFTSNAGLGRVDPQSREFKYFRVEDGIQSNEFNAGACFNKSGEFFFGGINGFNAFFPGNINSKKETSKIVFTNFQLADDRTSFAGKIPDKHISRTEHIKLNYSQNTFSLKFSELNFSENADNTYEYLLEGFEDNWRDLGKKRVITIGNLKPGSYTLHVRVRNDLTKKTSVSITVLSPVWQSTWAYAAYCLTAVLISVLVYRNIRRTKLIRKQFELKIRDWETHARTSAQLPDQHDAGATLPLKTIPVTSVDQRFLEKVIQIAEDHIEDSGFNVEKFAGEMFMSRSQLHRKLKTLTGHSATKFIRLIRLKRAAQLLSGNTGTVSEIAFKVGFENIGYFSKCFNETFGVPPSQYKVKLSSGSTNSSQQA